MLLRAGLLVVALGVAVLCTAPSSAFFVGGVGIYGLGLGVVDASTNMQAVALEHPGHLRPAAAGQRRAGRHPPAGCLRVVPAA